MATHARRRSRASSGPTPLDATVLPALARAILHGDGERYGHAPFLPGPVCESEAGHTRARPPPKIGHGDMGSQCSVDQVFQTARTLPISFRLVFALRASYGTALYVVPTKLSTECVRRPCFCGNAQLVGSDARANKPRHSAEVGTSWTDVPLDSLRGENEESSAKSRGISHTRAVFDQLRTGFCQTRGVFDQAWGRFGVEHTRLYATCL